MVQCIGNTISLGSEHATLEDKTEIDTLISALIASGNHEILVDLGASSYLPSELMGLLMWKKKELQGMGVVLRVIRISPSLYRIFSTAMVLEFFGLDGSEIVHQ